ncbi:MAG: hypothetical protein Q4P14_01710 [Methanobacteriaceae archaeon]|nr:hypothetical protein [Methanobacteriaceae archaeon]
MRKCKKNENALNIPENIDLAFFAYGIFKPGQLAYSKIKDHVPEKKETMINYSMRHRDGVPILINDDKIKYGKTKGYILNFNDNKKAYEIISQTMSKKLYEWNTIEIKNQKVNVLFGKDPDNGSNPIEGSGRTNFDGKNDPLFKEGIALIKKNLKSEHFDMEEGFFSLQMNYMLLWSAIDRYCKLKYNQESEHCNRIKLSKDKIFQEALEKYAKGHYRKLFSTDDLTPREFDIKKPKYCINYYYTLRCNIVHRGKTSYNDIYLLEQATEELLNIFEYILKNTFNEKKRVSKKNNRRLVNKKYKKEEFQLN